MKTPPTMLKLLFLLVCSLLHFESYGQKEANNWYFGGGVGINFNFNPPRTLQGGMSLSHLGHSAISDANGNLQFYTGDNGSAYGLWSRNHQPLPNSNGISMGLTYNSFIVPWPTQAKKYYVFYSNFSNPPSCELYSIVDMNLNNGFGDVTATKNVCISRLMWSNKVGVQHRNNRDFWVIQQQDSSHIFDSYLVGPSGLNTNPVTSRILGYSLFNAGNGTSIKISPDGKTLAFTEAAGGGRSGIFLLNFNAITGFITYKGVLPDTADHMGLEFSPDGTKLYSIRIKDNLAIPDNLELIQYDLEAGAGTLADIFNSAVSILQYNFTGNFILNLNNPIQVAPNGKIYVAAEDSAAKFHVIHRPNLKGKACRFVPYSFETKMDTSLYGPTTLPTFIQSYFYRPKITMQQTCFGDTAFFALGNNAYVDSVEWNFGDPASGMHNTSTLFNPKHFYATPGPKQVQAIVHFNFDSDTLTQTIYIPATITKPNLGNDTTICAGDTLRLNAYQPGASYEWQDSINTDSVYVVTRPGTYWVSVSNGCGTLGDSIVVNFAQPLSLSLPADTTLCPGQTLTLQINATGGNLIWSDSTSAATFTVSKPGTYWAELRNACGSWRDSITVNYRPEVTGNWLPKDTILCSTSPFEINGKHPQALSYKWQDGSTFSSFTATVSGMYWLEITTVCTMVRDSIQVTINKLPESRFRDTTICTGDNFVLTAPKALSYRWSTGDTTQSISINKAGMYKVEMETVSGCFFTDSVTVQTERCFKTAFIPNIVTPNSDNLNDKFEPKGLEAGTYELSIYNRWGTLIYRHENYSKQWPDKKISDGTYYYLLQNKQTGKIYKGWVEVVK